MGLGGAMVLLSLIGRGLAGRLAAAGWFLLAGFGGGFLLWVWAFSEHWGAHANQTALLLSPLGLALAVLVLVERWERARIWLAGGHLLLCGLGVLLFAIPGVGQEHAGVVALAVPANLGAAWVAGLRPGRLAGRRAGWGGGRSAVADEGGEVAAAGGAAAG